MDKSTIKYVSCCTKPALLTLLNFQTENYRISKSQKIATCGYWCVCFIKSGMTVDDFYEWIDSFKVKDKDSLVVDLIVNGMPMNKRRRFN